MGQCRVVSELKVKHGKVLIKKLCFSGRTKEGGLDDHMGRAKITVQVHNYKLLIIKRDSYSRY